MSYHQVRDLRWAAPCAPPSGIPRVRRAKGAKAAGLRYEKRAARALPACVHNPWFQFEDRTGKHYACMDLLAQHQGVVVAIECKLSYTPEAFVQLEGLYFPILRHVYRAPVRGIQLVKHVSAAVPKGLLCDSLASALRYPPDAIPVLHWLGKGPL